MLMPTSRLLMRFAANAFCTLILSANVEVAVELIWEHDLVLGGKSGDVRMTLDSASKEGASPMQALAFALAGCMAMDVVHVLRKSRHDLRGLRADLTGQRAPEEPRRFTHITLHYTTRNNTFRVRAGSPVLPVHPG